MAKAKAVDNSVNLSFRFPLDSSSWMCYDSNPSI